MKKLNLIFSILIALCIGCGDDDDNRIDQIEATLSTSLTAYQNAPVNSWIEITDAEYNGLIAALQNVQSSGATDANYNNALSQTGGGYTRTKTIFNTNPNRKVPRGNYLFAFRYLGGAGPFQVTEQKIMLSYDAPDSGAFVAGDLPIHEVTSLDQSMNFVFKGDYLIENNQDAFLGIYTDGWTKLWSTLEDSSFFGDGITATPSDPNDNPYMYQALSTSTKQW